VSFKTLIMVALATTAIADKAYAQYGGGFGGRGGGFGGMGGMGGRNNNNNSFPGMDKDKDRRKPPPKLAPMQPVHPKGPRTGVDRIACVIEDEVITVRELEKKAQPYLAQLEAVPDVAEREKKRIGILKQVLNLEIDERIVSHELGTNKDKLGVTEQDVDRAVQEVLRMNNIGEDQLQAALYTQGMTWSEYRKKLRDQIERARLVQFKVQGRVQVKEAEVMRRCEERARIGDDKKVCALHVLLRVPDGAGAAETQKLYAKAAQLQVELANGADFKAYAAKYSDDKASPEGKICFQRGEMVEEFEKATFALKGGEVSQVVKTPFGFHIIKLAGKDAAAVSDTPPNCVGEALQPFREEIYHEEMERQMGAWMQELRAKAFIDVRI
jgi:peptidyl-prolyl cis-trans isomerase SurA